MRSSCGETRVAGLPILGLRSLIESAAGDFPAAVREKGAHIEIEAPDVEVNVDGVPGFPDGFASAAFEPFRRRRPGRDDLPAVTAR